MIFFFKSVMSLFMGSSSLLKYLGLPFIYLNPVDIVILQLILIILVSGDLMNAFLLSAISLLYYLLFFKYCLIIIYCVLGYMYIYIYICTYIYSYTHIQIHTDTVCWNIYIFIHTHTHL